MEVEIKIKVNTDGWDLDLSTEEDINFFKKSLSNDLYDSLEFINVKMNDIEINLDEGKKVNSFLDELIESGSNESYDEWDVDTATTSDFDSDDSLPF